MSERSYHGATSRSQCRSMTDAAVDVVETTLNYNAPMSVFIDRYLHLQRPSVLFRLFIRIGSPLAPVIMKRFTAVLIIFRYFAIVRMLGLCRKASELLLRVHKLIIVPLFIPHNAQFFSYKTPPSKRNPRTGGPVKDVIYMIYA